MRQHGRECIDKEREKPDQLNDQVLLRCREGNLPAFQQLVEHYQNFGYSLAYRLLGASEDARDILQEAFLRVWKHREKIDPDRRFSTWFYTIVTHLCYDHIKHLKRNLKAISRGKEGIPHPQREDGFSVERELQKRELAETIRHLTLHLAPKQRMVFVIRDLEGYGVKDVCRILKMSENRVKSNLYHARSRIREGLKEMGYFGGDNDL